MRVDLCLMLLLGGAVHCGLVLEPGTTVVRAPSFDSAIITSDRLGGNFAYSTAESHAYIAVNPVVQNVQKPVAVSYSVQPVVATDPLQYSPQEIVPVDQELYPQGIPLPKTVVTSLVSADEDPVDLEDSVADESAYPEVSEDELEIEAK